MHLFSGESQRLRRKSASKAAAASETEKDQFRPTKVLVFDLAANDTSLLPLGRFAELSYPDTVHKPYEDAAVLIRIHGVPLGIVKVPFGDDLPGRLRAVSMENFGPAIRSHLQKDGIDDAGREWPDVLSTLAKSPCHRSLPGGAAPKDPLVTVIIPSLDHVDQVVACVEGILRSRYSKIEIVVVNNDPRGGELEAVLAANFRDDNRVRYAHQPKVGLSLARNAGIEEAKGEIVVFADDDIVVDIDWIGSIVDAFASNVDAVCVTGPILVAEVETPAQQLLEQFGGFDKGFESQIFDMGRHRRDEPMYPFDAGRFGSGANMAFRIEPLRQLGGFATDLGPGTCTYSGEDIDLARRTVWNGHQLVYEPSALVWHFHRRRYEDLTNTVYRYGVGLGAMITKSFFESRRGAWLILRALPTGAKHMFSPQSKKNSKKSASYPAELNRLELRGLLMGPIAYARTRISQSKLF